MHLNKGIKIAGVLLLVLLVALAFTGSALAGEGRTGEKAVVGEDEVIDDDLFISGVTIFMDGTVTGDCIATGETVYINGVVEGNLITSGATLYINGEVQGSVIAASYTAEIGPEASLARNLYYAGFELVMQEGAMVGRSVYSANYQVVMDGDVGRDISTTSGAFVLNGSVGGDVHVELGEAEPSDGAYPQRIPAFVPQPYRNVKIMEPGLTIGERATIDGTLTYYKTVASVKVPADIDQQVQARARRYQINDRARQRIGEFVALIIVGAVLLRFQPDNVQKVIGQIKENALFSGLWGIAVVLLFPLALALAFIVLAVVSLLLWAVTLGVLSSQAFQLSGLTLGALVFVFGLLVAFVTKAIFAYLVGRLALVQLAPRALEGRWGTFWSLVLGALLYELIRWIPVLGLIIAIAVVLVGVGAVFHVIRASLPKAQAAA